MILSLTHAARAHGRFTTEERKRPRVLQGGRAVFARTWRQRSTGQRRPPGTRAPPWEVTVGARGGFRGPAAPRRGEQRSRPARSVAGAVVSFPRCATFGHWRSQRAPVAGIGRLCPRKRGQLRELRVAPSAAPPPLPRPCACAALARACPDGDPQYYGAAVVPAAASSSARATHLPPAGVGGKSRSVAHDPSAQVILQTSKPGLRCSCCTPLRTCTPLHAPARPCAPARPSAPASPSK